MNSNLKVSLPMQSHLLCITLYFQPSYLYATTYFMTTWNTALQFQTPKLSSTKIKPPSSRQATSASLLRAFTASRNQAATLQCISYPTINILKSLGSSFCNYLYHGRWRWLVFTFLMSSVMVFVLSLKHAMLPTLRGVQKLIPPSGTLLLQISHMAHFHYSSHKINDTFLWFLPCLTYRN